MNLSLKTNKLMYLLINIALLLSSCTPIHTTLEITPISKIPTTVYRISSYITELTLVGLTQRSELIVRGRITGSESIINMARDVNDINKPDAKMFGVGQIYGFEVTQKIKVSGSELPGSEIKIVQAEGLITSPQTNPPSTDEIETARTRDRIFPLIKDQEYILFLRPLKGFNELKFYFIGTAHPWQFVVEKGCAYPETPWYDAKYYYQPRETEKFVAEIIASLSATVTPQPKRAYPVPGGEKSTCPTRIKSDVPYP